MAGRRSKRIKATYRIPVGFLGSRFRFTGELVDISTTGILVRCDEELELGSVGRMAIPVGYETCRVVALAKRRISGVGIAFEFSHMAPHDRELLRRLMLRLTHPIEV